jgi:hypothetical protein
MRRILVTLFIGLFTVSGCFAQEQSSSNPPAPQNPPAMQSDAQNQMVTIPAGTKVPVTLTVPIRSRSSRRGDPVRAVTAFPVTIGTRLAIPAGSYVDGTLEKVKNSGPGGNPELQVHFTRIVFTNGYTVSLDAIIMQAKADDPDARFAVASATDEDLSPGATLAFQQRPSQALPPLPPLPPLPKPNVGVIVGVVAGVAVVGIVAAILVGRHRGAPDYTLYDVGSQFDLVFQTAITLDGARVAAAVNPAQ